MLNFTHVRWVVFGNSVKGPMHIRSNLPRQDEIKWVPESGEADENIPLVLAIADGHGSSIHFRSDEGARIAVDVATTTIRDFLNQEINASNISAIKNMAYDLLPKIISRKWESKVKEHIDNNKLTDNEIELLKHAAGKGDWTQIQNTAYGTTLLVVGIKQFLAIFLQIGDGDILTVDDNGEVSNPILNEKRLVSTETSSLCMTNNWREFRTRLQIYNQSLPALILVSTDGYSNSFGNDEENFRAIGKDYLEMITNAQGYETVKRKLKGILTETAEKGSGDDITLGMIFRTDFLDKDHSAWFNKGKSRYNQKKYQEAIECYDKALEIESKNADAWNNKGIALGNLRKYQEAIECYDKALEIESKNADVWNNKGSALDNLGEHREAIEYYDKALQIESKNADVWKNKGSALDKLGEHREAIEYYDKALQIDPKHAGAWNNKGIALGNLRKYQEAISCFDKSLEIESKNADVWNNKGADLVELKKYQEAIECYDKALELKPDDPDTLYNKGLDLFKLKKYQEAISCFDKALELKPDDPDTLYNRDISLRRVKAPKNLTRY